MGKPVTASESAVLDAGAADIYRVLSDYVTEHPQIVPKPFFEKIVVEEGGRGAGTVFTAHLRVWGSRQSVRMFVSEPEPGRVLREEDPATGMVTTFTLTPVDGGARTRVEIATVWSGKPGLRGLLERWMNPRIVRPIYRKELALLAMHLAA